MRILYCYLISILFGSYQEKPCVDWKTATNFYFYQLPKGKSPEKLSWQEITALKPIRLNEAGEILKASTCKPSEVLTWMEEYLLVVSFKNGIKKKFIISNYGGFLSEIGGQLYYVADQDREKWQTILQDFKLKAYNQR